MFFRTLQVLLSIFISYPSISWIFHSVVSTGPFNPIHSMNIIDIYIFGSRQQALFQNSNQNPHQFRSDWFIPQSIPSYKHHKSILLLLQIPSQFIRWYCSKSFPIQSHEHHRVFQPCFISRYFQTNRFSVLQFFWKVWINYRTIKNCERAQFFSHTQIFFKKFIDIMN